MKTRYTLILLFGIALGHSSCDSKPLHMWGGEGQAQLEEQLERWERGLEQMEWALRERGREQEEREWERAPGELARHDQRERLRNREQEALRDMRWQRQGLISIRDNDPRLDGDPSPHETSGRSTTSAHYAARNGDINTLEFLINNGIRIDRTDENGMTTAHYAARNGDTNTLEFLRANDVKLDQPDGNGMTPARYAVRNGDTNTLEFLRGTGARLD